MIGLRDDDVHYGLTGATPEQKYVKEPHRWDPLLAYQPRGRYNTAVFGVQAPIIEETNPDGEKVSGRVLRGTVGLYVDHLGKRMEATTVCREFINYLQSLLEAVRAAGIK
jgi:hypothetical protein